MRIAKTFPKCIMSNQWHRSNFKDLFRFYGDLAILKLLMKSPKIPLVFRPYYRGINIQASRK